MVTLSAAEIIYKHQLTFDPGDHLNGSLYLCEPLDGTGESRTKLITDALRDEDLWSSEPSRFVPAEFRQAYNEQLEFVDCVSYENGELIISRFDHPKYPPNEDRWKLWVDFFDQRYSRDK